MKHYDYDQITIFDLTLPQFQIDRPIRLIELFAGIGSQAMALRDLGADFEHWRVVEFEPNAVTSYNAIHGTHFEPQDITKITGADLGIVDTEKYCYIMTYSFPCQDLSSAGKQRGMKKGSGTRSGLLWEVERLLNEVGSLPQVLLMENVTEVHGEKNAGHFQSWISFLESKGYSNYWQDINASDYGVAQNRDRCIMVSILGQYNYKFPRRIQLEKTMEDYLEPDVESRYFVKTEKAERLIQRLIDEGQIEPGIIQIEETGGALKMENPGIVVVGSLNPEKEIQDRVRVLGVDGICQALRATDYKDPPKILGTIYTDVSEDFQRGLYPIARCVKASAHDLGIVQMQAERREEGGAVYLMRTYFVRRLTARECWRLMDFSDSDYEKAEAVNSQSQLYREAGNSIVKNVLMAVFGQMLPGKEAAYNGRK